MGKKVFNAKARQNPKTTVDNSSVKNIKIELEDGAISGGGYDEANALVLPSKKRETKIKVDHKPHVRILSKKERKRLQSIVDKKKKKEGRSGLLEALATVQIPEDELKQYTSISQAQTLGVKNIKHLDELLAKKEIKKGLHETSVGRISAIKGSAKRKLLIEEEEEIERKRRDPNFVGLNEEGDDSESEDSDSSEEEESEKMDDVAQEPFEENLTKTNDEESRKENEKIEIPKVSSTESSSGPKESVTAERLPRKPAVYVAVNRDAVIQAARLKLPILAEEQQVMETINENSVIIISGETGSGKTTQVPQFLYESGYTQDGKMIGVTEPRRVAAIAMSKRVAHEMNLSEREVSYLIRFEGNASPDTRIKFMTDGVLLKEVESDFLLSKYSVIILDEAHERSAYTDILIGLLSRIVPLREKRGSPLKLIIMSATLRVEDFSNNRRLFQTPPPVLKVEARQFPVTIHFQKNTPADYVEEAYRKTVKIHAKLPEGGILIFLTGQLEVNQLVRKLRRTFPYVKKDDKDQDKGIGSEKGKSEAEDKGGNVEDAKAEKAVGAGEEEEEDELALEFDMKRAIKNVRKSKKKLMSQIALPKINLDDYKLPGDDTEADMLEGACGDSDGDDRDDDDEDADPLDSAMDREEEAVGTSQPLWVLPLYSLLSSEKQQRIFQRPPEGCRLCVVSTNVAETSLTIPNIKYVVDSGRQKTRLYDKITGVSAFVVAFTSQASADQRAGRAGRISAGHCYRLYSSAVYNTEFEKHGVPDIQKKPVDDLMLQMRCMGIERVVNFPFPSPPDVEQLQAAERRLVILGALEEAESNSQASSSQSRTPALTQLGRIISRFPVAPRYGKMLALSHQHDLMPYTVLMVAALSVQEVLIEVDFRKESEDATTAFRKWHSRRLSWASTGNFKLLGDPMVLLRGVGAAEYAGSQGKLEKFCSDNGMRLKAVSEVRKMRVQLTNEINLNISDINLAVDPAMTPPTDSQARFLRQILLAGMGDRVARKVPLHEINDPEEKRRLRFAYNCVDLEEPLFMHSSSVLADHKPPEWVIYQEAYEIRNGDSSKMFIRGITAIDSQWLLVYVPLLCNIRTILDDPLPRFNDSDGKIYCHVEATFSKAAWPLPLTEMEMPEGEKAYNYFGMFLLDGVVCPNLEQLKPKLKAAPTSLVKSWANLNENILRFKRALRVKQINTRQKLFDVWETHPDFLLEEYHNMLYDVSLSELSVLWPPNKE